MNKLGDGRVSENEGKVKRRTGAGIFASIFINMFKEMRILPGYRFSPKLVEAGGEDLAKAGREGNLESLMAKSFGSREIAPDIQALVLPKLKPYAPGPGMDQMIFVAKKDGVVSGLADLEPDQLVNLFEMAKEMEDVYEQTSDPTNPITKKILAINYHQNPLSEKVFQKKLHAQTLKDLHVHVTAWREQDLEDLSSPKKSLLSKQERRDVQDPLMRVVEELAKNPMIRKRLSEGLTTLHLAEGNSSFSGLNFSAEQAAQTGKPFAQDLITLHKNTEKLYNEIISLFVDSAHADRSGMPSLRSDEDRALRLTAFLETIHEASAQAHRSEVAVYLRRLSRLLKSGEMLLEKDPTERGKTPIFLKSFAYTLSIIEEVGSGQVVVNMAPRLLSTGNMLATLGLHKMALEAPPEEYLQQRKKVEKSLKDHFQQTKQAT